MLIQKKSPPVQLKLVLEIDLALKERLDNVRDQAAKLGFAIDLESEIVRLIAGQVTRAERRLREAS